MPDPNHLRQLAARMIDLSRTIDDKDLAARLASRASDYLDQAAEIEKAAAQKSRKKNKLS
jgi:hypothetical protein